MASSLIPTLAVTAPATHAAPAPVTDGEHGGLLQALSVVPDPRDPGGVHYPLAGLLAVAVCAVLAGASSFAAITGWLHDLDDQGRSRLGLCRGVPVGTTVWRVLTRLDAAALAGGPGWLATRPYQPGATATEAVPHHRRRRQAPAWRAAGPTSRWPATLRLPTRRRRPPPEPRPRRLRALMSSMTGVGQAGVRCVSAPRAGADDDQAAMLSGGGDRAAQRFEDRGKGG
ncbi:transposase family protein [Micromonospora globispora]|uniref:transposase family protein n=1 Tax=Micromonospora globispora TaxID=1450148 RepID=UPI003C6CCAD3